MTVCFFGDSFVNGTGDEDFLGWPARVCAAARRNGHHITHYNLGVRRNTSRDIGARWRSEAEARLASDPEGRLAFSFGANDCALDGARGDVRVPRPQVRENAHAILGAALAWRPTLMIGPAPVSDDSAMDLRIAEVSADLEGVCRELGVPYLPVFKILAGSAIWAREAASFDGTHPSAGGYAMLAEVISTWHAWRAWFDVAAA
jgi:acyl-CoA thioesterase I